MKNLLKKIKSMFTKTHDDKKLKEYHYEMNNMSNDGWTMLHYRMLHKKRLKELSDTIDFYLKPENVSDKMIHVISLFFDE